MKIRNYSKTFIHNYAIMRRYRCKVLLMTIIQCASVGSPYWVGIKHSNSNQDASINTTIPNKW